MKKVFLRSVAVPSARRHEHFVALWSSAMWALGLVHLLMKFHLY